MTGRIGETNRGDISASLVHECVVNCSMILEETHLVKGISVGVESLHLEWNPIEIYSRQVRRADRARLKAQLNLIETRRGVSRWGSVVRVVVIRIMGI